LYHEVIFYIIIGKKTRTKYLISVYADGDIEISDSRDRMISNTDFYSKTGINLTEFKYIPFYDIHKGETNIYDESGKIIGKMISLGGGKGKYIEYYPNGNIESEIEYYNGKMDGKDIEYNEDGSIEEESVYKNGKRNGKFELFYDNGNLKSSVNLINNKREGK